MPARSPSLNAVDPPPSLQEIAFKAIKRAIMGNQFQPANIYSEQAVAKEMGISKTPVHQALLSLESRGFVTLLPRRGFRVNVLTAKNISDMFELRRALERSVITKIVPAITEIALEAIKEILDRLIQSRDPVDFQKHDRDFHRYLAELSENTYIIHALQNVWDLSDWVGARILSRTGRFKVVIDEHLTIYKMLEGRDPNKAAAAMEKHLSATEDSFLKRQAADGTE